MKADVELAPVFLDRLKDCLQLAFDLKIERHEKRCLKFFGQRLDIGLRLVVEIGDGEVGAEDAEGLGAAPSDRLIVSDAGDKRLLTLKKGQGRKVNHACLSLSTDSPCACSTDSVWRAIISSSSVGIT